MLQVPRREDLAVGVVGRDEVDGPRFRRECFREDVLRAAAARTRRRLLLSLLAAAVAVVGLWGAALRPRGASPGSLGFALALLALLAFLSLRRRLRRLVVRWSSFQLTVEEDSVAREVEGFPAIRIARADVESVEERAQGLVVRSRSGQALLVPRELEGYERARELLAAWSPPGAGRAS